MILKKLEITHTRYYNKTPLDVLEYKGSIEFFNNQEQSINMPISQEQMAAIINIIKGQLLEVATQTANSLSESLNGKPLLENKSEDL